MKLFVGSLPFSTTDEELNEFFAQFGTVVDVKIIKDRETGRSRGFGFVEMGSKEDGELALEKSDGAELGGRQIAVKVAHDNKTAGGARY